MWDKSAPRVRASDWCCGASSPCAVCCSGWARDGSSDLVWQKHIAQWFCDNGVTSSFYWCLNPNSGDTGEGEGERQHGQQGQGRGTMGKEECFHFTHALQPARPTPTGQMLSRGKLTVLS
jgi:hypothetical protein